MNKKEKLVGFLKKMATPDSLSGIIAGFIFIFIMIVTINSYRSIKIDPWKTTEEVLTAPVPATLVKIGKTTPKILTVIVNEQIFWEIARDSDVEVSIDYKKGFAEVTYFKRFGKGEIAVMHNSLFTPKKPMDSFQSFFKYEPSAFRFENNKIIFDYRSSPSPTTAYGVVILSVVNLMIAFSCWFFLFITFKLVLDEKRKALFKRKKQLPIKEE
ncbi:MAG: hypothetical protein WAV31_03360 [Candidatus Moraniibacteriota bacterium]